LEILKRNLQHRLEIGTAPKANKDGPMETVILEKTIIKPKAQKWEAPVAGFLSFFDIFWG